MITPCYMCCNNVSGRLMEEDSSWSAFAYAAVAVAGLVLYLVYRYVYVSLARYTDIMN